jgi:drug/metabolite transporter (DMT)-like permease
VRGGDLWAIAQIAVVVVCYAVGPYILNRHLSDAPGLGVLAASLLLTALIYLPFAAAQAPHHRPSVSVLAAVAGLALVCTAVAFLVFVALIAEVGPVRATVITYVNPAVAVALGVLLLDEPLTAGIVVGFVLVLAGSVLATGRARPPGDAPARGDATVPGGAPARGDATVPDDATVPGDATASDDRSASPARDRTLRG